MAKQTTAHILKASSAEIVPAQDDPFAFGEAAQDKEDPYAPLAAWVMGKHAEWKKARTDNYAADWDSFERLWRGIYDGAERLRESERSRIVTPALSEAVENAAAEIEEATFGRGDYFDLQPYGTEEPQVKALVDAVREALREDLGRSDFAANVAECILNAAVYGTGIGEIVLKESIQRVPTLDSVTGMPTVVQRAAPLAGLRAIHPRNFVIDPAVRNLEDALGVMIEENIGQHVITQSIKAGVFREVELQADAGQNDPELQSDRIGAKTENVDGQVHVIKYYGLVPAHLLYPEVEQAEGEGVVVNLFPEEEEGQNDGEGDYVEAIVVVGNSTATLKAEANPFLMQDRPIVAFRWDTVPGRFYGRGICEKGASSQKLLDAESRARIDSLAITYAPMMGMDATRIPRGFKFEIRPGKTVLTQGNPAEVLHPFKFGQLDANHWTNAATLQQMVQQATGSFNASGLGSGGDARPGAVSMQLAPVIKRYKRTMIGFLDRFLMPAIEKITWRNMQFQPKRYPPVALRVSATSTLGIMQREYETSQLTALLNTMQPGTPQHNAILVGIIGNTSIADREKVIGTIEQAAAQAAQMTQITMAQSQAQPVINPLQQAKEQLELLEIRAKIRKLEAEANKLTEEARSTAQDNELEAIRIAQKGLYALDPEDQQAEFDRRYKLAKLALEERSIQERREDRASNERIAENQMAVSAAEKERERQHQASMAQAKTAEKEVVRDPVTGQVTGLRTKAAAPLNPTMPEDSGAS
jgi:hypothetical protein